MSRSSPRSRPVPTPACSAYNRTCPRPAPRAARSSRVTASWKCCQNDVVTATVSRLWRRDGVGHHHLVDRPPPAWSTTNVPTRPWRGATVQLIDVTGGGKRRQCRRPGRVCLLPDGTTSGARQCDHRRRTAATRSRSSRPAPTGSRSTPPGGLCLSLQNCPPAPAAGRSPSRSTRIVRETASPYPAPRARPVRFDLPLDPRRKQRGPADRQDRRPDHRAGLATSSTTTIRLKQTPSGATPRQHAGRGPPARRLRPCGWQRTTERHAAG